MFELDDQTGKTFVVTGANSGLGKETAKALAGAGGHVILTVRNLEKGEVTMAEIRESFPDASLMTRRLDLADLASVRAFAAALTNDLPHLDVLVNNAGVMAVPTRMLTVDGYELQFATNFLGPFALTNLLLPLLLAAPAPRVATMSSGLAARGRIDFDDLQAEKSYRPTGAYAQSKLADLYLARHLAAVATERGWPLLSLAAHPGYTKTNLQTTGPNLGRDKPRRSLLANLPLIPSLTPPEGAASILFAACSREAEQGGYYGPTGRFGLVGEVGPVKLDQRMADAAAAAQLWALAEDLTATHLPS